MRVLWELAEDISRKGINVGLRRLWELDDDAFCVKPAYHIRLYRYSLSTHLSILVDALSKLLPTEPYDAYYVNSIYKRVFLCTLSYNASVSSPHRDIRYLIRLKHRYKRLHKRVPLPRRAFNAEIVGNVSDLCPVGALTSKPFAFSARGWELVCTESIDVLDSLCSNIRIEASGTDVSRISPRINYDLNYE
jgi:hypothetical protein